MKHPIITIVLVLLSFSIFGQSKYKQEVKAYQAEQTVKFKDDRLSPLKESDRLKFDKLKFYKPRKSYKVTARFTRTSGSEPFEMPTTTDRKPVYEKFGELHFEINGKPLKLDVYQSHDGRRNPLYRNMLFLPFKDLTNSKKTYGGGRFVDLKIPKGDTIEIDFNKAYNPYCAYNEKYSCPIVPKENHLDIAITAGVKRFKK